MLLNPNKVDNPDYKEHIAGRELSDKEILQTLHRFPELLRKPILFNGERAVAGYVPERLESVVRQRSENFLTGTDNARTTVSR